MPSPEIEQLIQAYQDHFLSGNDFGTIVQARQFAEPILEQKIERATLMTKIVDEAIESALVRVSRQIASDTSDRLFTYDRLVDLYQRQPTLSVRTSDSILRQAYSTPVPIAYLAASLVGIDATTRVYEPTAGNGALLLLANPQTTIVNEINAARVAELRAQGFIVTQENSLTYRPDISPVDVVITNPPFGSIKTEAGVTQMFQQGLLYTSQIDHVIALRALDFLKRDGRAVLILGGKFGDEEHRSERYNTQLTRGFYRWLYRDAGFQVEDHFSIAGSLYRKQGAGFPIDIVLINGRGDTQLELPAVKPPRIYRTYDELRPLMQAAIQHYDANYNRSPIPPQLPLQSVSSGTSLDSPNIYRSLSTQSLANVVSSGASRATEPDYGPGGVPIPPRSSFGEPDRAGDARLADAERGGREHDRSQLDSESDRASPRSPRSVEPGLGDRSNTKSDRPDIVGTLPVSDELLPPRRANVPSRDPPSERNAPLSEPRQQLSIPPGMVYPDRIHPAEESIRLTTLQPSPEPSMSEELQPQLLADSSEQLENQVPYVPRSQGFSLDTLTPASAMKQLELVFDRIEAATGKSVDDYVMDRLQEPSLQSLYDHYAAEQIDSLALAIYNYEYSRKATLVGHDTGIGKTRIDCGLMRYALNQGLTPVVVTADPVLFNDILGRDAVNTGNRFNPLFTANSLSLDIRNESGQSLERIATPSNHGETIRKLGNEGNIGKHDCILTTYSQLTGPHSVDRRNLLQSIAARTFLILDESHKAGGPAGEPKPKTRAQLAREEEQRANGTYVGSCTEFFQELVTQTPGFVALSATAIKDPIIASRLFYETTDLIHAAQSRDAFADHLKHGGAPLQQFVFSMWTQSGGCIRCEKSYEGIELGIESVPVNLDRAEDNVRILKMIYEFDRAKNSAIEHLEDELMAEGEKMLPPGAELSEGGIQSTNFTSVLHNLQSVSALALKAEYTAREVVRSIEQGQKPVVMIFNTVESAIQEFVEAHNEVATAHNLANPDEQMQPIAKGDAVALNAGHLFMRYLEKSRMVRIAAPYLDPVTGKRPITYRRLTDKEIGEAGVQLYERARAAIEKADWSGMPISPIDYMKAVIKDAGYSVGEITGRTQTLEYGSAQDLQSGVVTYSSRRSGTTQKRQVMDGFQNGEIDCIITNSTTGYSLHAARSAADQRQRAMFLLQPHLDINQVEQSIGRTHRSGQVNPAIHPPDTLDDQGNPQYGQYPGKFGLPVFRLIVGKDLPTEERPVAVLASKMRFLKANTTGNARSNFQFGQAADFLNPYGAEVIHRMLLADPKLDRDLGSPLGDLHDENNFYYPSTKDVKKVTGRIVMLASEQAPTPEHPHPSLQRQAQFYETLNTDYQDILAQKMAMGENALEAQRLDIQAKPVQRMVLNPGEPSVDSPFTAPTYLVEVLAKTGTKPHTTLQVVNAVRSSLALEPIDSLDDFDEMETSDLRQAGRAIAERTLDELKETVANFIQGHEANQSGTIQVAQGRLATYEQRLSEQQSIHLQLTHDLETLEQRYTERQEAVSPSDLEAVEQLEQEMQRERAILQGKRTAQEAKIVKLERQIQKSQQEIDKKEVALARDLKLVQTSLDTASEHLAQFPIGQPVVLTYNETGMRYYGVVANVAHRESYNPASLESWKVSVRVVDGLRQLNLKFSEIGETSKQVQVQPVEVAPSYHNPSEQISVYNLFDERQQQSNELRYLVAGQVMRSSLSGKFAQITDHQGEVHSVYLLPRIFSLDELDKQFVKFSTPEQIKEFFDETFRSGLVTTLDSGLTIRAQIASKGSGLELVTPRNAAKGEKYYNNEELKAFTGDFVSTTENNKSVMFATVPPQSVDAILAYLLNETDLQATNQQMVAREITGQQLLEWEPCDTITPKEFAAIDQPLQPIVEMQRPEMDLGEENDQEQDQSDSPMLAPMDEPSPNPTPINPQPVNPLSRDRPPRLNPHLPHIAPSPQQKGAAEKNIARLLHQAGLAEVVLQDMPDSMADFYLKVENEPYIPLVIERHGDRLYLAHYLDDAAGELYIDSEMVFALYRSADPTATQLKLIETATASFGGEYRTTGQNADRGYAKMFSRNLIEQKFPEAARGQWLKETRIELENAIIQEFPTLAESLAQLPPGDRLGQLVSDQLITSQGNSIVLNAQDRSYDEIRQLAETLRPALQQYVPDISAFRVVGEKSTYQITFPRRDRTVVPQESKSAASEEIAQAPTNQSSLSEQPDSSTIDPRITPNNPLGSTLQASAELLGEPVSQVIDQMMGRFNIPSDQQSDALKQMGDRVAEMIDQQQMPPSQAIDVLLDELSSQQFPLQLANSSPKAESTVLPAGPSSHQPVSLATVDRTQLSSFFQEYVALKEQYPEAIALSKHGSFYQTFFEDAVTVAQELKLPLTSRRNEGEPSHIPMVVFPELGAKVFVNQLELKGYTVVLADQVPIAHSRNSSIVSSDTIEKNGSTSVPQVLEPQIQNPINQPQTSQDRLNVQSAPLPPASTGSIPSPQQDLTIWQAIPSQVTEQLGAAQIVRLLSQPDPIAAIEALKLQNSLFTDVCNQLADLYRQFHPQSDSVPASPINGDRASVPSSPSPLVPALVKVREMIEKHDRTLPNTQQQNITSENFSPSLQELRSWYVTARELGRSQEYLERIVAIGQQMKALVPQATQDANFKSPDFTISSATQAEMQLDIQEKLSQQTLSQQVNTQARQILATLQQDTYQGRIYQLQLQQDSLTISAGERGVILNVQGDRILQSSVTSEDAQRFERHVSQLQQPSTHSRLSTTAGVSR